MDGSANPEAAPPTSHVKFEVGKSFGGSVRTRFSDSKGGSVEELPLEGTEKTDAKSESESEEEKEREAIEDKIKAETPQPKERPGLQVT